MLMSLVSSREQTGRSWACTPRRQVSPSSFSSLRKCDAHSAPRACVWRRPLLFHLMLTSRNWALRNLRPSHPPTLPHPHIHIHMLTPTHRPALNNKGAAAIALIPSFQNATRSSRQAGSGLSESRARLRFGRRRRHRRYLLTRKTRTTRTTACERITFTCRPRHRFPVIFLRGALRRGRPLPLKP